ncbi:hypothetical protein Q4493_17660 [Colwellia sp. 1_MG-2023]|uniref:hypothetical protein n=1 Tax=Colwellia sp. 1_MG-2023 TaxID=3062649 RepID=UPI0026E2570D|nr:hypothetical protein [Colwellia sp. 1_MG-2023]MDO6447602.1 hypothetical protein [Colwellia sp. 1_MG-2023]
MVLPKTVYENLPYLYFLASGGLLALGDGWALIFSAGIFYAVACIVLVSRSAHRRLDKHKTHSIKYLFPELVYEYLPYTYVAIGIFVLMSTVNPLYQFAAFTLLVLALRNLLCRKNNRAKSPSLF